MPATNADHECDLAALQLGLASRKLYGIEAVEQVTPEDAFREVLNIERYLRQAQRHLDAFKARCATDYGIDESDFAPNPMAAEEPAADLQRAA